MGHFFRHLHTVNHHRRLVRKVCFKIGIPFQGLTHDLSKYSKEEFWTSVKFYTDGTKSPTEKERLTNGYSLCWMHHKGRNKHHFEYWFDIDPKTRKYTPVKMPIRYLKEMFADRIAASKTYLKDKYTSSSPLEYLDSHNPGGLMHIESYNKLHEWLTLLSIKGEKETFKIIKKEKEY
jgi:hypothetical protein